CMQIVDSVMVSSIGMVTAVGNAGNVTMLNDCLLWGILSGIAIFSAQFYGAKQYGNFARTFALSVVCILIASSLWTFVVYLKGEEILLFYLNDPEVVQYSLIYLKIIVLSFFPAWFNFCVITMYRSMRNTRFPFYISTGIALLNVLLNALFIYLFKWGIAGAAWGTFIADIIGSAFLIIVLIRTKPLFVTDLRDMLRFDKNFLLPILAKTAPIVLNETLYGFGSSLFAKAYGKLGTKPMDAYYISQQAFNLFTFALWGFGGAVSILVGTTLGAGELEKAKRESKYQLGAAFILGVILFALMVVLTPAFLSLYRIDDPWVYDTTRMLMYVLTLKVFLRCFNYMMMSTLKAGGDARILNILDSGIMYSVGVTSAFLTVAAGIDSIVLVLLICQIEQVVRLAFTMIRYKKGYWIRNLTTLVEG
ncbi:MAG: MATE family efflux transporter, partial [Erysipelotrichaceae bacterium]|nr:MATE family efflux transporter [Erysipelotrichaceae bacterium]